ncbi:MAG TPA: hypothetical protein VGX28_08615 [Frankiaceae bacterium]|jgi:hypothetical protein|nr:hypothetical protein [Frankiaceae bacterium]
MRTSLALAAAAVVVAPATVPAAEATPLCYAVVRAGTLGPPLTVGPVCVPVLSPPANCQATTVSTTALNVVTLYYCLPR